MSSVISSDETGNKDDGFGDGLQFKIGYSGETLLRIYYLCKHLKEMRD